MMKEICLSIFVTVVAFALIFVLDVIADSDATSAEIDKAVRGVIKSIAVLIGFSWEKAFDFAVEGLTKEVTIIEHSITKLILASLLAAVVVPAWRWYILPTILEYEEAEEMERKEEEQAETGPAESSRDLDLDQPLLNTRESSSRKFRSKKQRSNSMIGLSDQQIKLDCLRCKKRCRVLEEENQKLRANQQQNEGPHTESDGGAAIERLTIEKRELEKKNRMLEDSMDGLHAELGELQKLAELLG